VAKHAKRSIDALVEAFKAFYDPADLAAKERKEPTEEAKSFRAGL
jgi:hypothetical protein